MPHAGGAHPAASSVSSGLQSVRIVPAAPGVRLLAQPKHAAAAVAGAAEPSGRSATTLAGPPVITGQQHWASCSPQQMQRSASAPVAGGPLQLRLPVQQPMQRPHSVSVCPPSGGSESSDLTSQLSSILSSWGQLLPQQGQRPPLSLPAPPQQPMPGAGNSTADLLQGLHLLFSAAQQQQQQEQPSSSCPAAAAPEPGQVPPGDAWQQAAQALMLLQDSLQPAATPATAAGGAHPQISSLSAASRQPDEAEEAPPLSRLLKELAFSERQHVLSPLASAAALC